MTESPTDRSAGGGQLDGEAAVWCSRMHGPDSEAHRAAFEAWLKRGALHRQAYNRIEEVYLLGARLPPRLLADASPGRRRPRASWIAAGAAIVAMGLVASPLLLRPRAGIPEADVALLNGSAHLRLSTLRVSSEAFRLADGSLVTLGPDSEVAVNYDARERRLRLARGRSRFDVAPQRRPFIVEAGSATITARGTSFEVALNGVAGARVKVRAGAVDVQAPVGGEPDAGVTRRLTAGEEMAYGGSAGDPKTAVEPRTTRQPLTVGELVAQANMQAGSGPRLRLDDEALASVALGGDFRVHEPGVVAERLALMLDLRIRRSRDEIVLQRRR